MNISTIKNYIANDATEAEIYDIMQKCAARLNWQICIESDQEIIRGLTFGTQEYMDANLKEKID